MAAPIHLRHGDDWRGMVDEFEVRDSEDSELEGVWRTSKPCFGSDLTDTPLAGVNRGSSR
jgi:hypothetical protein